MCCQFLVIDSTLEASEDYVRQRVRLPMIWDAGGALLGMFLAIVKPIFSLI